MALSSQAVLKNYMQGNHSIPLDELEADLATTDAAAKQKTYALQNAPPVIIFSTSPAVLALIVGDPVLRPAGDSLQKVLNSRTMILFSQSKKMFYLALMDGWVQSPTITGPWGKAEHEPTRDLNKVKQQLLAANENQPLGNPKQSLKDAYEDGDVPTVYSATVPAELVLSEGPPQFTPILGTNLLYVSNSGSDIFMDSASNAYYLLLGGPVVLFKRHDRCSVDVRIAVRRFHPTSPRSRPTAPKPVCWFRFLELRRPKRR